MNHSWDPSSLPRPVECPASREPAVRSGIVAVMLLGFGVWCYADRRPNPGDWSLKNINAVAGYVLNNWGPYVMVPAGAAMLIWIFARLRRRLVADEKGVGYVGREKIAWDQVDSLDAGRLQSKGIVVLHAGDRRLVLDSYHLRNFRELIALVERHVPPDKQVLK